MARLNIALGQRSYDIAVEAGALGDVARHIAPWTKRGRSLWVTDSTVARHHWPRIAAQLEAAGIAAELHVVPAGEASKSWAELARLTDWLLGAGIERSDTIFALGGGMIGDLTGFAASIVKRGCDFVQVPTTLLAQVDSSVGGKTAINTAAGKNLVGAFHQPRFVLIDPQVLATLPPREMRAGYAEVVKYGLIDDAPFFDWCEAHGADVLAGEPQALDHAIVTSVAAKARIVGEDERETKDRRALLNPAIPSAMRWKPIPDLARGFCTARRWASEWCWRCAIRHGAGCATLRTQNASPRISAPARCRSRCTMPASPPMARRWSIICGMTRRWRAAPCPSCSRAGSGRRSCAMMSIWPMSRGFSTNSIARRDKPAPA